MIELRNIEGLRGGAQECDLVIDGQIVRARRPDGYGRQAQSGALFVADTKDEKFADSLVSHRFSDIPEKVSITFPATMFVVPPNGTSLRIRLCRENVEEIELSFLIYPDLDRWRNTWDFQEFIDELSSVADKRPSPPLTIEKNLLVTLSLGSATNEIYYAELTFKFDAPELIIREAVHQYSDITKELFEEASLLLQSKHHQFSVVTLFDFPEEVRITCEQYLLYFGQFLKDLGVEARTEIQHEAGQVLFAVTPADKQTALDKIRTALETYLQLPSNPAAGDASMIEYEVAVQRLAANVDHLKGQLRLAHAELRLAGATMQTQQVTISRLLSGDVIVESLKDITPKRKEEDREELLGGTVALTKTNWKGVEFNLPEIFRKLRRLFNEGE